MRENGDQATWVATAAVERPQRSCLDSRSNSRQPSTPPADKGARLNREALFVGPEQRINDEEYEESDCSGRLGRSSKTQNSEFGEQPGVADSPRVGARVAWWADTRRKAMPDGETILRVLYTRLWMEGGAVVGGGNISGIRRGYEPIDLWKYLQDFDAILCARVRVTMDAPPLPCRFGPCSMKNHIGG